MNNVSLILNLANGARWLRHVWHLYWLSKRWTCNYTPNICIQLYLFIFSDIGTVKIGSCLLTHLGFVNQRNYSNSNTILVFSTCQYTDNLISQQGSCAGMIILTAVLILMSQTFPNKLLRFMFGSKLLFILILILTRKFLII